MTFLKNVPIPRTPHPVYRFTLESLECLPDAFHAPFIASIPVLETTVRVLYAKDKFRVDLHLSFTDDVEKTMLQRTDLVDGTQWILKSPMLPGQCIFTRWAKLRAEEQQPPIEQGMAAGQAGG